MIDDVKAAARGRGCLRAGGPLRNATCRIDDVKAAAMGGGCRALVARFVNATLR